MSNKKIYAITDNQTLVQINVDNSDISIGTYVGDGASSKTINVEREIEFGIIYAVGEPLSQTITANGDCWVYAGMMSQSGCSADISIVSGGFQVKQDASSPMDGKRGMLNQNGKSYIYVVWSASKLEIEPPIVDAYTKSESDARYAPIAAAIRPTVTGETISVNDSVEWPLQGLTLYGKSTQDGTPTPETPIPIVSTGDNGSIEITISGENIFDPEKLSFTNVEKQEDDFFFKGLGRDSVIFLPVNNISTNDKLSLTYTAWTSDGGKTRFFTDFYPDIYGGDVENIIVSEKTTKSYSFSPKNDIDSCGFRMYVPYGSLLDQSPTYLSKEIMLVRGSQPKPYSPFVSQKLNVNLINNLFGIPVDSGGNYTDADGQQWICDEVDFGKGTHTQRIGKISSYNSEAVGNIWMSTTGQLTPGATVLYRLDNPIVSNLDAEMIADYEVLTTYAPVTNIMTDNTPSAGLSVRYVADAQKYIDNKLSTINTQLLEVKTNV